MAFSVASKEQNPEISLYMTVILIFLTHGFVNTLLLTSWNPLRCAYWNVKECTEDQSWILNWLAQGHFHVHVLLACLARTAMGSILLEQRLAYLTASVMLSDLSTGIFALDYLNKPMAALQCAIYIALLATIAWHTATAPHVIPLPTELRSSSFDRRQQLPVSMVAVTFQFLLAIIRVFDMTFGSGRDVYLGNRSSAIYQIMSNAAVTQMLWTAIILCWSVLLANPTQQKTLLLGQAAALFVSQVMLAGYQGENMETGQLRAAVIGTFFSILIALAGAC